MKCIKRVAIAAGESETIYERVSDEVASQKVASGKGWTYCSKEEWRKNCRDVSINTRRKPE
jgi:hypothetical protein